MFYVLIDEDHSLLVAPHGSEDLLSVFVFWSSVALRLLIY